MKSEKT
jgi:hypothetical protein